MAFSPGRLISRRLLSSSWSCSVVHRLMSTATAPTESLKISSPSKTPNYKPSHISPWLMLPPTFADDSITVNYRLYSFADSKLQTLTQTQTVGLSESMLNPIHDLRFRGSSHGWIALFNPQTFDLVLYDLISLRHIKLPPMPNSPNCSRREVTKVTLSSSPDDKEHSCRAVVSYTGGLAYCCPGRSKEWTSIGTTAYKDFVYSARQNLFFGLNDSYELETWDFGHPSSPRKIRMIDTNLGDPSSPRNTKPIQTEENKNYYGENVSPVEYLVVIDELLNYDEDDVLVVTQHLNGDVLSTESYAQLDLYPPTTSGFDIDVYDEEEGVLKPLAEVKGKLKPLEDSLGDMTLFVGCHSDSVALLGIRFPEVKQDSIYFTQALEPTSQGGDIMFSHEDYGIFNYKPKNLRACYIPCDVRRPLKAVPSEMLFFPRPGSV